MPTYQYTVRDRGGAQSDGMIEAKDPQELRKILRSNDLFLLTFRNRSGSSAKPFAPFAGRSPKTQEIVVALRQLGTLLRSGLPVVRSLQLVEDQAVTPTLKAAIRDIRETVTEGSTISAGMRRHPKVFSSLVVSFVEAAEAVGNLDSAMELSAEQIDRDDNLRRQVKQATLYPKFVIIACAAATFAMLMLVVPTFNQVYASMDSALPAPTQFLVNLNSIFVNWWWLIGSVALILWFGFRAYRSTDGGRRAIDRVLLDIPLIGPLARKIAIARIVQTLSDALRGGVPLLKGLAIAAGTGGNTRITDAVHEAAIGVREGQKISDKLAESGEFPSMVTQMIEAGEASGNVEEMLDEVSRFYRRDVEYSLNSLTKMIEPTVTVIVGGVVLLVLVALYMPIFNLSNALQGKK
ncbi:MAG: type II secretion system F family protein [Fimbriimonas sp.]